MVASFPHRKSLSLGPEGKPTGHTRAVRSEKYAVLRQGGGTGMCGIAACVARALQKYPGRACMAFLLRPQEVRRVDNTCTQFDPKTLDSLVHYVLQCRRKGQWCDKIFIQRSQALARRKYLSQKDPPDFQGELGLPAASSTIMNTSRPNLSTARSG